MPASLWRRTRTFRFELQLGSPENSMPARSTRLCHSDAHGGTGKPVQTLVSSVAHAGFVARLVLEHSRAVREEVTEMRAARRVLMSLSSENKATLVRGSK